MTEFYFNISGVRNINFTVNRWRFTMWKLLLPPEGYHLTAQFIIMAAYSSLNGGNSADNAHPMCVTICIINRLLFLITVAQNIKLFVIGANRADLLNKPVWEFTQILAPMPVQCQASVYDAGPTLNRHWMYISCSLNKLVCGCTQQRSPVSK